MFSSINHNSSSDLMDHLEAQPRRNENLPLPVNENIIIPKHIMLFDHRHLEKVGPPYSFFLILLKNLACLIFIPCLAYVIHTVLIYYKHCENFNFVELLGVLVTDDFIIENINRESYLKSLKRRIYIDLANSLIFLVGLIYILMKGKKYLASFPEISKYTLWVSNIPNTETTNSIIKFFAESSFSTTPTNISLIPNYKPILENKNKISKLLKKVQTLESLIEHNKLYSKSENFQSYIQNKKGKLEEDIRELRLSISQLILENPSFSGKAFVSFTKNHVTEIIYNTYNSLLGLRKSNFPGNRHQLIFEYAPNPDEILTENIFLISPNRKCHRFLIFFFEILLFFLMEVFIYWFFKLLHSISHNFYVESIFSMFVIIVGAVFSYGLRKLVSKEKHISQSKKEFFAILLIFPFVLANIVVYEYGGYFQTIYSNNVPSDEELLETKTKIVYISTVISIIEPILKLIWTLVKRHIRNSSTSESNSIPSLPSIELSERYMDAAIILCVGIIGAPSCPGVLVITLIGLFLNFWIFKYLMVYVAKVEVIKDDMFVIFFLKIMVMSHICFCVGAYYNSRKILSEHLEAEIKMYAIFIVYGAEILIIMIFFFFHLERLFKINDKHYNVVKEQFYRDIEDPYDLQTEILRNYEL